MEEKTIKLLYLLKLAKQIEGKTKLNKIVFLGQKEEGINFGFNFQRYNYGPYSFDMTESLNELEDSDFIEIDMEVYPSVDSNSFQSKQFRYKISEKGEHYLKDKNVFKDKEEEEKIKSLLAKWNSLSRKKIIEHVYSNYM